jgi:uncharacterized protein YggE
MNTQPQVSGVMKRWMVCGVMAAMMLAGAASPGRAQVTMPKPEPTLSVTGQSQIAVKPDRAVIRLGAVAQSETAAEAQAQVNRVMTDAIAAIKRLGIQADHITTASITLSPVYKQGGKSFEGEVRITGYRAENSVQIVLDDMGRIGPVVDAGIAVGANQLQELTFTLADDTQARTQALAAAAKQARTKAGAIAKALEVEIVGIERIHESSGFVPVQRGGPMMMRAAAMDAGTPVEAGQVTVEAQITVEYRIKGGDAAKP